MIKFKKFLLEKAPVDLDVRGKTTKVFVNPGKMEILNAFRINRTNEVQFLINKASGQLFVWGDKSDQAHVRVALSSKRLVTGSHTYVAGFLQDYHGEFMIELEKQSDADNPHLAKLKKLLDIQKVAAYEEVLLEKAPIDLPISPHSSRTIKVLEDPYGEQILRALATSKYKELRFAIDQTDTSYVWDSDLATHQEVIGALHRNGIIPERFNYQNSPCGYMSKVEANFFVSVYNRSKFQDNKIIKRFQKIIGAKAIIAP